jgi:hypothetical protein
LSRELASPKLVADHTNPDPHASHSRSVPNVRNETAPSYHLYHVIAYIGTDIDLSSSSIKRKSATLQITNILANYNETERMENARSAYCHSRRGKWN